MYAIIVKSNISDIERIELSYDEVINILNKRATMYDLEYAIIRSIEVRKTNFEALALRPLYLKYIRLKESIYGPSILWSNDFSDKIDNEFVKEYLL